MSEVPSLNYGALAHYASSYLLESWPDPIHIGAGEAIPDCDAAVYVAIDVQGNVAYVGSACRPDGGRAAAQRLAEHLRRHDRFQQWDYLYLFPLRGDTPLPMVRRIEGRIGRHLRPSENMSLPSVRKRRT